MNTGNTLLKSLINAFGTVDNPATKHLQKSFKALTEDEMESLNNTIAVFVSQGADLEEQCLAYRQFLKMTLEETKYFVENGSYRYHSFAEVADRVYWDKTYMKRYMIGLALSAYLWDTHKRCYSFFKEKIREFPCVDSYGEVGPGHGAYFRQAVHSSKFNSCTAIDLSPTSLKMTEKFVNYPDVYHGGADVHYVLEDVNKITGSGVYDVLVMCEVLEHVEEPLKILKSLRRLLKDGGRAYLSIPINAPQIDHITLFETPEEVADLLQEAGFVIQEQRLFTANDIKIERALKYKEAILMCVWLS